MKTRTVTPEAALVKLETLCARSEQCSADLRAKLERWNVARAEADKIMKRLAELKFVDDARFARAYCNDKLRFSGWGRRKISQGLWAKRIPRELIAEAFDGIDEEEYVSVAATVIAAKARSIGEEAATREGRMKIVRYGMSRGFEPAIVIDLVKKLPR